jgi:hypothetical protein
MQYTLKKHEMRTNVLMKNSFGIGKPLRKDNIKWIIVNSMKIQDELNLAIIGATGSCADSFESSDLITPDEHLPK